MELQDRPPNQQHLEEELAPSGWMMLNAKGQNQPSVTAQQEPGETITATMGKMLALFAQVGS